MNQIAQVYVIKKGVIDNDRIIEENVSICKDYIIARKRLLKLVKSNNRRFFYNREEYLNHFYSELEPDYFVSKRAFLRILVQNLN